MIARRREENRSHHVLADADHLPGPAVGAGLEPHPQRAGQVRLHHPLRDRRGGAAHRVDRPRVQGAPRPVRAQDAVEDGLVDVQLRVPVAGVVLQELRDDELVRVDPPPGAAAVVPDPGVAGLVLQVLDRRPRPGHHRLLDRRGVRVPRRGGVLVAGGAGVGGGALERHPEHGDALRRRERHVQERHRLPGGPLGLGVQLGAPLRPGLAGWPPAARRRSPPPMR